MTKEIKSVYGQQTGLTQLGDWIKYRTSLVLWQMNDLFHLFFEVPRHDLN